MKFVTDSVSRCVARLGKLTEIERMPDSVFETPLLLVHTQRGTVPHLCKDVLKMLTKEQQFMLATLPSTLPMADYVKQCNSFSEYVSLQEYPFLLGIQDPTGVIDGSHQSSTYVSIWSRNGRFSVTPEKYMKVVETFKPDVYVALCDGATDAQSSQKRVSKAADKSKNFLEKCIRHHENSEILKNKGLLGSVQGGYNLHARENYINFLKDQPLLGYVIDGLHTNGISTENITMDQIRAVIEHCLNLLPVDKLKVMIGSWNPAVIMDLVALGIDVFDSSYAYLKTEDAKALVFLCTECNHSSSTGLIDFKEKRYIDDFEPICKSCTCLTCKNHTRAYIYHLIQTKELLAQVLLMIHNSHVYIEFFKSIRHHIKHGSFHEFRNRVCTIFSTKTEKS
ncbi:hypothetical protein QAD02_008955 [Eretmocerus hayati]|uniref:Uncharacterized protein n=1 Tax=Eretmocerus hayati TaxID=131215 RepID=A0ACC2N975_9HYME|nr:hypothetical protein QAD02_008955 [Eretmocerus hayati]